MTGDANGNDRGIDRSGLRDAEHAPTAEFRAGLEKRIVREFRATHDAHSSDAQFGIVHTTRRGFAQWLRTSTRAPQMRAIALLTIGLFVGVGATVATAQVRNSREWSEISSGLDTDLKLAQLRLELAESNLATTKQRTDAGAAPLDALYDAQLEVRVAQGAIARLGLDAEEMRLSSRAPRNELYSPLVKGRDFVKERLTIDASVAQERLRMSERNAADVDRKLRVGAVSDIVALEAENRTFLDRSELALIAQKLSLRSEFLADHVVPAHVSLREQILESTREMQVTVMALELARRRAALVARKTAVGVAESVDVKRAELDVLERSVAVERARVQLDSLNRIASAWK